MNYLTIYAQLKDTRGKVFGCQVVIRDGFALSTFSDPTMAKMIYDNDKKAGVKNIYYDEEKKAYVQEFKNQKIEDIKKIIIEELENNGGKEINFKEVK
jgi:hypothetical protein